MAVLSFIVITVFLVALITIGVMFTLLINKNLVQGQSIRQKLAQRVNGLRMSKMLSKLGIDFDQYLHQAPLHKINESMNKCDDCKTIGQCDEVLKQPEIKPQEIDFCPNQSCLSTFSELQQKESTAS